jgi:hypothetical protein
MFTRPGWRRQLTKDNFTLVEDPDVPFTIDLNLFGHRQVTSHPIEDPIQFPKVGEKAGCHVSFRKTKRYREWRKASVHI